MTVCKIGQSVDRCKLLKPFIRLLEGILGGFSFYNVFQADNDSGRFPIEPREGSGGADEGNEDTITPSFFRVIFNMLLFIP